MADKLPELQRRSIRAQINLQLQKYQIDLETLWPQSTDTQEDLRLLVNRRNTYLHQGKMEDVGKYLQDIERLQVLLEAFILRVLECPDNCINPLARPRSI